MTDTSVIVLTKNLLNCYLHTEWRVVAVVCVYDSVARTSAAQQINVRGDERSGAAVIAVRFCRP